MYQSLIPTNATTLVAHIHMEMKQLLQSQLFSLTQTAKYETKRSPGVLYCFHEDDLKIEMSFLD